MIKMKIEDMNDEEIEIFLQSIKEFEESLEEKGWPNLKAYIEDRRKYIEER